MFLNIALDVLLAVFVCVCVLLILVVLMQRSKQDGLGAAFGGGLTETVFGAQTSSILIRFTSWLIAIFFVLAVLLAYLYGHQSRQASALSSRLHPAVVPAAPASETAPAVPAVAPMSPAASGSPVTAPVPAPEPLTAPAAAKPTK
jgi:preprotein translocase subunit SecG